MVVLFNSYVMKFVCKKDLINDYGQHLIVGRSYELIGKDRIFTTTFIIRSELSDKFHLDSVQMFDYFYTEKELRKLKLDKINSVDDEGG